MNNKTKSKVFSMERLYKVCTKNMTPKKLGPKSLVKIGPVTAEILLIWTYVTRAYVASTNVTITVGIF